MKIMHKSDKEPKQGLKQYPQHKRKCPFPLQTTEHAQKKLKRIFKDKNLKISHKIKKC